MEFIEGKTLREQLATGAMDNVALRRLSLELAGILAHVHALNVIHSDIKPENILLDREGHAHLIDFGLASSKRDDDDEGEMRGSFFVHRAGASSRHRPSHRSPQ